MLSDISLYLENNQTAEEIVARNENLGEKKNSEKNSPKTAPNLTQKRSYIAVRAEKHTKTQLVTVNEQNTTRRKIPQDENTSQE